MGGLSAGLRRGVDAARAFGGTSLAALATASPGGERGAVHPVVHALDAAVAADMTGPPVRVVPLPAPPDIADAAGRSVFPRQGRSSASPCFPRTRAR